MGENIFENILDGIPTHEEQTDYVKNGILHCAVCNEPKQGVIELFGRARRLPMACKCKREEMIEIEARIKHQEFIDALRRTGGGLGSKAYEQHRFENSQGGNSNAELIAKKYVDNWEAMKENGIGLIIGGPVGTGKTFLAGCIANALLDKKVRVAMKSFAEILNEPIETRQELINKLAAIDLLIVDDLGAERSNEYGLEQVFNLIDGRYKTGLPLIATTNLSASEIQNPKSVALKRIYDRVSEMSPIPILLDGLSRRTDKKDEKRDIAKRLLGLGG